MEKIMSNELSYTQIVVNGSPFDVNKNAVTYDDITLIAGHHGENDLTITYTRPPENNHGISGTLRPGHSIDIEPKMVFDAVRTNAG
jgi:hypothetical protein